MAGITANPHKRHNSNTGEGTYEGIPCCATVDLHPTIMNLVNSVKSQFDYVPLVLDLGAGRGAFSKRLRDQGYQVEAIELEAVNWAVPEVPLRFVDFCSSELDPELIQRYSIVVSIEVVEHVSDPLIFLKNIRSILKPGGVAIITTPNPMNLAGIALLSYKGELPLFNSNLYWTTGHRNILPDFLLESFAREAGYKRVELRYVCRAQWPVKLWLSLIPIAFVVLWNYLYFRYRWNKLHTVLIVTN